MRPAAAHPAKPSDRLAETLRAIRSARRTSDAMDVLRRFEASIRREGSAPPRPDRPITRAPLGPDWLRMDLKLREIAEAEAVLVELTLEMDAAVSSDTVGPLFERHTEQCAAVRRLRREYEREWGSR